MTLILKTATTIQKAIISKVQKLLKIQIISVDIPPQGMDSDVFFITDNNGKEYAVKYSKYAFNDVLVFNLINKNKIEIPLPKLYGYFSFQNKMVMILEKIKFPLLESILITQQHEYIGPMLLNLEKIHSIKSDSAGLLTSSDKSMSWKELLLYKYSGNHPSFNWDIISLREGVDTHLIKDSVKQISKTIENHIFIDGSYSFLHTDFNQRNIFVNPNSKEIVSIIDWSESMFGDPLYDFARVRMYIWHFNLKHNALHNYYKFLTLTPEEMKLEDLYLVSQILDYIAWYSEIKNNFNDSRLQLHQQFLREYQW